jgi:L-ascorbate metabolism protein UlaG (beta-lactamase superfamily)
MRKSLFGSSIAVLAIIATGCSGSSATPTLAPTASPAAPAATAATPTTSANTLTVAYEENCQVELSSPSGQRVLIDVYDPTLLTSPAKATDILLTTHIHTDHYLDTFESTFPGQKVTQKAIDTTIDGVKIKSIAASHDDSAINPETPTNYIFIIEFNGFKVVHTGSTGQLKLTDEQIAAIGTDVDLGLLDLMSVGGLDPNKDKAIVVAKQINPKVFLPTHTALQYAQDAGKVWKATYSDKPTVTIPHDQLPKETTLLFMGSLSVSFGAILNAPESKW